MCLLYGVSLLWDYPFTPKAMIIEFFIYWGVFIGVSFIGYFSRGYIIEGVNHRGVYIRDAYINELLH